MTKAVRHVISYCHHATNRKLLTCPRCKTTLSTQRKLNRHLFFVHKVKRCDRIKPLPIPEVAPVPPDVVGVVEDTADLSAPPLVSRDLGNEVSLSTAGVWDVENGPPQPVDVDKRANSWCSGLRQKRSNPQDVGACVGNTLALPSSRTSTDSSCQKAKQSTEQGGDIVSSPIDSTDFRRPSIVNQHFDNIIKPTFEYLTSLNSIAIWDHQSLNSHFSHHHPPWENRQLADPRCHTANVV